jgi:hypothetical protein
MRSTVLIYQMGKVGSSTLYHSLLYAGALPCLDHQIGAHTDGIRVIHTHSHNRVNQLFRTYPDEEVIIITMVRDLLRRTISAFFQNVDNVDNLWWYIGDPHFVQKLSTDELIELYRARQIPHYYGIVEPWFRRFYDSTNVDILQSRFPTEEGKCWISESGRQIGIIRTENLSDSDRWLARRVGIPNLRMIPQNIGNQKWYSSQYNNFIEKFNPNTEETEMYYRSAITRHFYDKSEIDTMIKKWRDKPVNVQPTVQYL